MAAVHPGQVREVSRAQLEPLLLSPRCVPPSRDSHMAEEKKTIHTPHLFLLQLCAPARSMQIFLT